MTKDSLDAQYWYDKANVLEKERHNQTWAEQ
jgi:hypothetical protein